MHSLTSWIVVVDEKTFLQFYCVMTIPAHLTAPEANSALTLLGLSPEWWVAISTFALAFVTLILVIVGWFQIREARKQNQRWRTLEVCDQYHLDMAIGQSLRRLRNAHVSGAIVGQERRYKVDVVRLLNYLDGLAIGIAQGLYIESLARDHMQAIVKKHVRDYLRGSNSEKFELERENFRYIRTLDDRWHAESRPHFVEGSR